jgi:polyribonucleotide nucleotidyltransferase
MKVERKFGSATVTIEAGHMARQTGGAVTVRCGDTMVLVTAVASKDQRTGIDFVPLTVDYQERFYAVGRIPGNFFPP